MKFLTHQDPKVILPVALAAAWGLLLLAAVLAYAPGLGGPFLFDDFGTITDLGSRGGVVDWETFKAFVFGGHAGPTGRPLALLTFLADATNWPADPWPFKRTNLVIHLANGALLGLLMTAILRTLEFDRPAARWIAWLAAGCWLLHPFLVSTTLYAVQRMAQLATLFIFAGMLVWLKGRMLVSRNAGRGYLLMSLAIGLGTLLALLSKENGILLPMLVGTLEMTIVSSRGKNLPALNRAWALLFIVLPSAVIGVYLGAHAFRADFFEIVPPRDFSAYERLLTESRVLVDYLRHWFIPELYTTGVFQDHFIKSSGLFSPVTTAMAAAFHLAAIGLALVVRRRQPLLSFAVLFFYASQLLESSVINLELYFEHRNYLSAAFLFVPLAAWLYGRVGRPVFIAVAIGALGLLGGFTRYSAVIWADYDTIVEASAHKAPTSARAQVQYATNLYNAGRYEEALQVLDHAVQTMPDKTSLLVGRSVILCNMGILTEEDFAATAKTVSSRPYDPRSINLYSRLADAITQGRCPAIDIGALGTLFREMMAVPANADPRSLRYSQIKYFIGLAEAAGHRVDNAVRAFEQSLASRPGAGHAMMMAAVLASNGYPRQALRFSDIALTQLDAEDDERLSGSRVNRTDILEFRAGILEELSRMPD